MSDTAIFEKTGKNDTIKQTATVTKTTDSYSRRKYFKREARRVLRLGNNYIALVFACTIFIMISVSAKHLSQGFFDIFNMEFLYGSNADAVDLLKYVRSYLCDLVYTSLAVPIYMGIYEYAYMISKCGNSVKFGSIFDCFGSVEKIIRLYHIFFSCFWRTSVMVIVLVSALNFCNYRNTSEFIILCIIIVTTAIFAMIFLQRSCIILYICIRYPEMSVRDAVKNSTHSMKGHKFEAYKLMISFIGWAVVSLFTLGLLLILYVMPYFIITQINFSEYVFYLNSEAIESGAYTVRRKHKKRHRKTILN